MYLKLITFYNSWDQLIFTYDTNHFENIYFYMFFNAKLSSFLKFFSMLDFCRIG